jgi:hypothetical protein
MAATGVQEVTSLAARYPQRLKPHSRGTIERSAEALRHPEKLHRRGCRVCEVLPSEKPIC